MKRDRKVLSFVLFIAIVCSGWNFGQDAQKGTLFVDVKDYDSEVKLSENIQKQLRGGMIEWGMVDKNLVVSMVNRKFVKPELSNSTRYGSNTSLQLDPGEYTITCIGYIHSSNSRNVEVVLSKSAYFNVDILKFTVLPGKTTSIVVFPTMQKQSHSSFAASVKIYMPDLKLTIIEDGVTKGEAIINEFLDSSIQWDDYKGPLKF